MCFFLMLLLFKRELGFLTLGRNFFPSFKKKFYIWLTWRFRNVENMPNGIKPVTLLLSSQIIPHYKVLGSTESLSHWNLYCDTMIKAFTL